MFKTGLLETNDTVNFEKFLRKIVSYFRSNTEKLKLDG